MFYFLDRNHIYGLLQVWAFAEIREVLQSALLTAITRLESGDDMRLEGKVALISGGSRGQGETEARLFAAEGAAVVIGDILEEDGEKLAAEIGDADGKAIFVKLDVTSEDDWRNAVQTATLSSVLLDGTTGSYWIY